jgi:hypothetical protein
MNMYEPIASEIAGLKSKLEFALAYVNELIFVLARAANNAIPWSDAPFSLRVYSESEQPIILKEISEETRLFISFILVDAKTRRVKISKACTFSPQFTQELYRLIALQRNSTSKAWNYDSALQNAYSRYSSEQLAHSAIVKCFAGD